MRHPSNVGNHEPSQLVKEPTHASRHEVLVVYIAVELLLLVSVYRVPYTHK